MSSFSNLDPGALFCLFREGQFGTEIGNVNFNNSSESVTPTAQAPAPRDAVQRRCSPRAAALPCLWTSTRAGWASPNGSIVDCRLAGAGFYSVLCGQQPADLSRRPGPAPPLRQRPTLSGPPAPRHHRGEDAGSAGRGPSPALQVTRPWRRRSCRCCRRTCCAPTASSHGPGAGAVRRRQLTCAWAASAAAAAAFFVSIGLDPAAPHTPSPTRAPARDCRAAGRHAARASGPACRGPDLRTP